MADVKDYGADPASDMAGEQSKPLDDVDALFEKLKRWFKLDFDSHGQTNWRKEAREDFAFEAGEQLTQEDKELLKEMNRPIVVFNRVGITVDAVSGQEVANRQEVQYLPRQMGDVVPNEMLSGAAKWFRQQCDAEDEESDAFRDTVVCGMGWTETSLDYEEDPQGRPLVNRVDPLEMVWDSSAKKRNLADRRRVFHIRRDIPIEDARALVSGGDFEDSDFNASWVDDRKDEGENPHENDNRFYNKEKLSGEEHGDLETVTMVRAQWWERVPAWLMVDPQNPDNIVTLMDDEYRAMQQKYKLAGVPAPKCVKTARKVYREAWLGSVLLEVGDAPIKGHFSFNCITGKRDRNKNTFFGIVRAMKDPARWSNKWLSQTMHIMNTSAKGGIAVEQGQFFADDQDGEASWARSDAVTQLKPGALSGNAPKFINKPVSQFPQSSFELMNFAVQSLPQVSGVNVEALGMQMAADQAAALDRQRKQSVMILLQPLFDGLRRYRKEQGRALLYLIQHYLSDGRLIKIEGQQNAQYVPLMKQEDAQYDIIVDEAPTSPNQKEFTWTLLQQLLPVIGKMLPPATWLALIKYSPLPASAQKDIADSIQQAQQQAAQQPNPEMQKAQGELAIKQATAQADIQKTHAETAAKIQGMHIEAHTKRAVAVHQAQTDAAVQAMTAQQQAETDRQQGSDVMSAIGQLQQQVQALTQALQGAMGGAAG